MSGCGVGAPFDLLIEGASEVVTCDGPADGSAEALLGLIPHGAVGVVGERVAWVGPAASVPPGAVGPSTQRLDAHGGFVGPGLVDPHTHLVFAGDRADEFERRCQGSSYLEIASAGGGIARTVAATRAASEDELVAFALPRLQALLAQGVTTAEVKSGYGLDVATELKMLRAIRRLGQAQPVTLVATYLGLHAPPPKTERARSDYVALCTDVVLPQVVAEGLARCCDAFVEETAFTAEEATRFLSRGKALGLAVRLHVDQLTAGRAGAELAASLGAVAADHLEQISSQGIEALRRAGVVAVLAPTSTLFARTRPFAPGRALRSAGVPVALCTNCNPGSSMSENVSLAMGLACLENGLTPAEAYLGFTRWAALALGDASLGRIRAGGPADLTLSRATSYRAVPYHLAMNDVRLVLKAGRRLDFGPALRQNQA